MKANPFIWSLVSALAASFEIDTTLQFIRVKLMAIETNGVPLEDAEKKLSLA